LVLIDAANLWEMRRFEGTWVEIVPTQHYCNQPDGSTYGNKLILNWVIKR